MDRPYCICKDAIGRGTHIVCGKEDEHFYTEFESSYGKDTIVDWRCGNCNNLN